MKLTAVAATLAALAGSAAAGKAVIGVTPFCSAIASAPKSASNCNRALGFFCDEMANCPFLADFQAQLDALQAEIASIRALLPAAARYEGANNGILSVGFNEAGQVSNVLTQVVSFPSATSTEAPNGVDQVSIFFTVTKLIDPKGVGDANTISWADLTNSEYTPPASAFTEGNGRVRCGVTQGYAGGVDAVNKQPNLNIANGFVEYGLITEAGLTFETDQLPVVNNFDQNNPIWPLGQYSCTFLVARA